MSLSMPTGGEWVEPVRDPSREDEPVTNHHQYNHQAIGLTTGHPSVEVSRPYVRFARRPLWAVRAINLAMAEHGLPAD